MPKRVYSMFTQPIAALGIAVLALGIGITGSLFAESIKDSTLRFLRAEWGSVTWPVVGFWLAAFLWLVLFYIRLIAESDQRWKLVSAIHRCPNPRVLRKYKSLYDDINHTLEMSDDNTASDDVRMEDLEQRIRYALTKILELAREFTDVPEAVPMGCNVMLIAHPAKAWETDPRLRFFNATETRLDSLTAVLHIVERLVVSVPASNTPHVPSIALPVPKEVESAGGARLALPGAPFALLTGKLSVHRDTKKLSSEFEDFDKRLRDELAQHFSRTGDGRNVRSFLSARIGDGTDPVGVLNVDHTETHILGEEPQYYETFLALLGPILSILCPVLRDYAVLGNKLQRW